MQKPTDKLKYWLAHPLTRDLPLDDPRTTELRRQVIRQNSFLMRVYQHWYDLLVDSVPAGSGHLLELGSGGGFLAERIPGLITSEIIFLDQSRIILDGQRLPFATASLKGILMTNVLHHIPSVRDFLSEAGRVTRPGGVISVIEPWHSEWANWVYKNFHHELFDPQAAEWEFESSGPVSSSNMALPWIIFQRDRDQFEREFPEWQLQRVIPLMPFAYLLSGGVSMRPLVPTWTYQLVYQVEKLLAGLMPRLAMFAHVVLVKKEIAGE